MQAPGNMLKLDALAPKTRPVFEALARMPALDNWVLVRGTAMALQLGHRSSEDLDLWLPAQAISIHATDELMRSLQRAGHQVAFATPAHQTTQFRINSGDDLRRYVQDWAVDGVKVQFFCLRDAAFDSFRAHPRLSRKDTHTTFEVMGPDGLFAMKSYVIHQRTRSRDLVDLWHFVQHGKTLADILAAGLAASPSCSVDYAKQVLTGAVPLDVQDEGFETLAPGVTLKKIYKGFVARVNALEVEQARMAALAKRPAA